MRQGICPFHVVGTDRCGYDRGTGQAEESIRIVNANHTFSSLLIETSLIYLSYISRIYFYILLHTLV